MVFSHVLSSTTEKTSLYKMSRAQAESVIKNIIREIAQECANKGQAVSETLVAFMVGELLFLTLSRFMLIDKIMCIL